MSRIVVQGATGGIAQAEAWAYVRAVRHPRLLHLLLLMALGCLPGCAHRVRVAPDFRIRPCGAVVDPSGESLDRSHILWMSPDDDGERAKLDAWCNTVGPVVVHEARQPSPVRTDRLVVIGWNVHLGAGDVVRLVDDIRRADRLRQGYGGPPKLYAKSQAPPRQATGQPNAADLPIVLLLQETFRSGDHVPSFVPGAPVPHRIAPHGPAPRRSALEIAAALGLNVYYLPTMRNGRGTAPDAREDRGLAILSSLPLSHLQAIELPLERQRRPAAAATIRLETSAGETLNLRLVNVHLESRSSARRLWVASPHARNRQGDALTASLNDAVPTVLEGDLNTWANREPVLERLGRMFTSCTDGRPTYGYGLHLDRFFARLPAGWTMTCRRLDEKYGSDHYPVVAVIQRRPD
jgi:endonuclease/exonuclease/phosphatase family metal-dependent hydrolase